MEEYEPDIVYIPGLKETYGIEFDRNHMLGPITTEFVMDQIIFSQLGKYRDESFFMHPETGVMPNWFFMVKM